MILIIFQALIIMVRFCECQILEKIFRSEKCYLKSEVLSYVGKVNETFYGNSCIKWNAVFPNGLPDTYNDIGDHNYCRNYFYFGQVHCYNVKFIPEECDVPLCVEVVKFSSIDSNFELQLDLFLFFDDNYQTCSPETSFYYVDLLQMMNLEKVLVFFQTEINLLMILQVSFNIDLNPNGEQCTFTVNSKIMTVSCERMGQVIGIYLNYYVSICEIRVFVKSQSTCSDRSDQFDYMGYLKTNEFGKTCLPWESMDINSYFNDIVLFPEMEKPDHYSCRALYLKRQHKYYPAMCFDYSKQLSFCRIPKCKKKNFWTISCYIPLPSTYFGTVNKFNDQRECIRWSRVLPFSSEYEFIIKEMKKYNDSDTHNYCRNYGKLRPWCFVDADKFTKSYCEIPECINIASYASVYKDLIATKDSFVNDGIPLLYEESTSYCYSFGENSELMPSWLFDLKHLWNVVGIAFITDGSTNRFSNINLSSTISPDDYFVGLNRNIIPIPITYDRKESEHIILLSIEEYLRYLKIDLPTDETKLCEIKIFVQGSNDIQNSNRFKFVYGGFRNISQYNEPCLNWVDTLKLLPNRITITLHYGEFSNNISDFISNNFSPVMNNYCRPVLRIGGNLKFNKYNLNHAVCFVEPAKLDLCHSIQLYNNFNALEDCHSKYPGSYLGEISKTHDNKKCLTWHVFGKLEERMEILKYENSDSHNYCRMIGKIIKPWCYVEKGVVFFCDVPFCSNVIEYNVFSRIKSGWIWALSTNKFLKRNFIVMNNNERVMKECVEVVFNGQINLFVRFDMVILVKAVVLHKCLGFENSISGTAVIVSYDSKIHECIPLSEQWNNENPMYYFCNFEGNVISFQRLRRLRICEIEIIINTVNGYCQNFDIDYAGIMNNSESGPCSEWRFEAGVDAYFSEGSFTELLNFKKQFNINLLKNFCRPIHRSFNLLCSHKIQRGGIKYERCPVPKCSSTGIVVCKIECLNPSYCVSFHEKPFKQRTDAFNICLGCNALGLAKIRNFDENDFIFSRIRQINADVKWLIGYSRSYSENWGYHWGNEAYFSYWKNEIEPPSTKYEPLCTLLNAYRNNSWQWEYCSNIFHSFICQYKDYVKYYPKKPAMPFKNCLSPERDRLYFGNVSITKNNKPCFEWRVFDDSYSMNSKSNNAMDRGDHNFCRLQNGKQQPWCYTNKENTKSEFCYVPKCVVINSQLKHPALNYRIDQNELTCQRLKIMNDIYFWDNYINILGFSLIFKDSQENSTIEIRHSFDVKTTTLDTEDSRIHIGLEMHDIYQLRIIIAYWNLPKYLCEIYFYILGSLDSDTQLNNSFDFIGDISLTASGKPCLPWLHIYNASSDIIFPEGRMNSLSYNTLLYHISNKCRLATGVSHNHPYCFTKSSISEVCDLESPHHETCLLPIDASRSINIYQGKVNVTKTGDHCMKWKNLDLPKELIEEIGRFKLSMGININNNYCRNFRGFHKPWCYTSITMKWDFCDVNECAEISIFSNLVITSGNIVTPISDIRQSFANKCNNIKFDLLNISFSKNLSINQMFLRLNKDPIPSENYVYSDLAIFDRYINLISSSARSCLTSYILIPFSKSSSDTFYVVNNNSTMVFCEINLFGVLREYKRPSNYIEQYLQIINTSQIGMVERTGQICDIWKIFANTFSDKNIFINIPMLISDLPNYTHYDIDFLQSSCLNVFVKKTKTVHTSVCFSYEHRSIEKCSSIRFKNMSEFCVISSDMNNNFSYTGNINITINGFECQPWNVDVPQKRSQEIKDLVNALNITHNYCRSFPNANSSKPWCYATAVFEVWDECDIPICVDITKGGVFKILKDDYLLNQSAGNQKFVNIAWSLKKKYLMITVVGATIKFQNQTLDYLTSVTVIFKKLNKVNHQTCYFGNNKILFSCGQRLSALQFHFHSIVDISNIKFKEFKIYSYGVAYFEESPPVFEINYIGDQSKSEFGSNCYNWVSLIYSKTINNDYLFPEGYMKDIIQNPNAAKLLSNKCRNPVYNDTYELVTYCYITPYSKKNCLRSKEAFHIILSPKTVVIYSGHHINCNVTTDKYNYILEIYFYEFPLNVSLFKVQSKSFYISDTFPIGIYIVTCQISYVGQHFKQYRKYIIIVKPTKLFIGPTQIKLNELISCYPYAHYVSPDMLEVRVFINWTIIIDSDLFEFNNVRPYEQEGYYLRIKDEGSFGIYEAHCKATVHIFSNVYTLEAHFNFKVTGFSKSINMEKEHRVPLFFFIYVTVTVLVSHYVMCYMWAYERTQRKILDIEIQAILESIEISRKTKHHKSYQNYNFNMKTISKYSYLELIKIIKEKKLEYIKKVSKSLDFKNSIIKTISLGLLSENNSRFKKSSSENDRSYLTFFVKSLSHGPFVLPDEPTYENLYLILVKKILHDDTIQMNRIKRLKDGLSYSQKSLFPKKTAMTATSLESHQFSSDLSSSAMNKRLNFANRISKTNAKKVQLKRFKSLKVANFNKLKK